MPYPLHYSCFNTTHSYNMTIPHTCFSTSSRAFFHTLHSSYTTSKLQSPFDQLSLSIYHTRTSVAHYHRPKLALTFLHITLTPSILPCLTQFSNFFLHSQFTQIPKSLHLSSSSCQACPQVSAIRMESST